MFILFALLVAQCGLCFTVQPSFAQDNDKNLAVVSTNRYEDQIPTGTVYVYNENSLIKILKSPENATSGQFSGDIFEKGQNLILSTPFREIENPSVDSGPLAKVGSVSIFDRYSGYLIKTIWNPEPNQTPEYVGGTFGSAVAFSNDNIVIGDNSHDVNGVNAAGSVYLYDDSGNLQMKIDNPDPTEAANFGVSLSSIDDKVFVGVSGKTIEENQYAGAVFVLDSKTGDAVNTINNPNPTPYAGFGFSMDVEKTKLVVSSPSAIINDQDNVGEVYIFDSGSGDLLKTIKNPDPDDGDKFGRSVMFAEDKVIVGAIGDGLFDEGTVYIFDAESGSLLQTIHSPQRIPKTGFYSNEFGTSLVFDGNRLAVGDPQGMVGETVAGIAYLFEIDSGRLIQTINNPFPKESDGFGYYLEFVGEMEPSKDVVFSLKPPNDKNDSNSDQSNKSNSAEIGSNATGLRVKSIRWMEEHEADYTKGGIGVIKLDNQDLNVNKDLIDSGDVLVWSDTDKTGIPVKVVETAVNTGVFYADINLSGTESKKLQIHVSAADTMTVSFADGSLNRPLVDTIKIKSKLLPPLQQLRNGIPIDLIACDDEYRLVIKSIKKPLCIKEENYERLVEIGYISN